MHMAQVCLCWLDEERTVTLCSHGRLESPLANSQIGRLQQRELAELGQKANQQ